MGDIPSAFGHASSTCDLLPLPPFPSLTISTSGISGSTVLFLPPFSHVNQRMEKRGKEEALFPFPYSRAVETVGGGESEGRRFFDRERSKGEGGEGSSVTETLNATFKIQQS